MEAQNGSSSSNQRQHSKETDTAQAAKPKIPSSRVADVCATIALVYVPAIRETPSTNTDARPMKPLGYGRGLESD